MDNDLSRMDKFEFLLGDWNLEYRVPKSSLGEADKGIGRGTIKRALGGRYVFFDYHAVLEKTGGGGAHGVFGWDARTGIYRYWWFEDSGNFLTASADFLDQYTLRLNWHDTLLLQTFKKSDPDQVILRMEKPLAAGGHELILEVLFRRK
jgi:hypothetical protein